MYQHTCMEKDMCYKECTLKVNTLDKFQNDKCLFSSEETIIIMEGCLLNKQKLQKENDCEDIGMLIEKMYKTRGEEFMKYLRGPFSGVLFDKKQDIFFIFTNQTGEVPVFYLYDEDRNLLLAGSQVNYLIEACGELKQKLTVNEWAACQMLTYGFMIDDSTFANEIHRLRGGVYLKYHVKGKMEIKSYHSFYKNINVSRDNIKGEEECIEDLDRIFNNAVALEYEKDEEYHYRHLVDLSGGLDSRMNMWVAHAQKERHFQLLTYCKANYADEIIAKQIANYWKDELVVKPLDDISYLYDIDDMIFLNGGLALYSGITGGRRFLELLDERSYGLEHTGQIGDAVIGSFFSNKNDCLDCKPTGRYSERLIPLLDEKIKRRIEEKIKSFDDYEIFLMYSRAFQGACCTHMIRRNYTEVTSPFLDVDLLEYCLNLPPEYRMHHYLYKKWICSKYPDAAEFTWEKMMAKVSYPKYVQKFLHLIRRGPNRLLRILGLGNKVVFDMNPLDYWVGNNLKFQEFFSSYINEGFELAADLLNKDLLENMKLLLNEGSFNEKAQVATVLGALKLYFHNAQ